MDDTHFMEMALDLAERGRGFTTPNPMVGAVVVKGGAVVGRGYHARAGEPHAEANALQDAGEAARDATLYVTLEPCNHTGRTPPCTEAILAAGIRRVVVAAPDPNPNVKGGGSEHLKRMGLSVSVGVLRERAETLNEFFNTHITTGRPFVIAKCAATLDGRIATRTGDSKWITGEAARAHVHRLRHAVDAILVGRGTVVRDDPHLNARIPGETTRDPLRIVLDTQLRIPGTARLLHLDSNAGTLIICGDAVSESARRRLESDTVRILPVPVRDGCIAIDGLMDRLGTMGVASVLIEGGGRVLASAFRERIVDKCAFYYAPKILGGDDGEPMLKGQGPALMAEALTLDRVTLQRFGADFLVEGYVKPNRKPAD